MATAITATTLVADDLRVAVRESAFVERGATWGQRTIGGRAIDWAEGRRFEVAVFHDKRVAFHLAGEHGTVAFVAEHLLAPTAD